MPYNGLTAITNAALRAARPGQSLYDGNGVGRKIVENKCTRSTLELVVDWDGENTSVFLDRNLGFVDKKWDPISILNDAKSKIE